MNKFERLFDQGFTTFQILSVLFNWAKALPEKEIVDVCSVALLAVK